jgi:hypothetical protein
MKLYKQFKDETDTFQSSLNTLQSLHKKISSLEKINQDLLKKTSVIDIDYVYLENSQLKPPSGTVLVFNKSQTYFYIIFSPDYIDYPLIENNVIPNTKIGGWYYDVNGWRSLLVNDNDDKVLYKKNVTEDQKTINGGLKYNIIQNESFKSVILRNNEIINIYSNFKCEKFSMFHFKNIHKLFIYDFSLIFYNKMSYFLYNCLFYYLSFYKSWLNLSSFSKLYVFLIIMIYTV